MHYHLYFVQAQFPKIVLDSRCTVVAITTSPTQIEAHKSFDLSPEIILAHLAELEAVLIGCAVYKVRLILDRKLFFVRSHSCFAIYPRGV